MLIEPRQVERGAVRRWSRQSFGLIRRGAFGWLAIALGFCLGMFLGQRVPLLLGVLALSSFFASILVAAHLDRPRSAAPGGLLAMLRQHVRLILSFATAIACAGALIWMLLLARPGVPWTTVFYTERNTVDVLSPDGWIALRQIFAFSAYALGLTYFGLNIPGLTSLFQFPCTALLDLPWREAYRLSAAGAVKNLPAVLVVGLMFVILPVLAALVLPPLVPLLYCFLAALCYVSFRDIFLGISDNRALETAAPLVRHAIAPARSAG